MNTTNPHSFLSRKAAFFSSIMCVLAMLVLVVSCPLKRMLQNKVVSNTSAVIKTNQGGKFISNNTNCFFDNDKIFSIQPELSGNQTLPYPLNLPALNKQPGEDIHYLQSGLHLNDFNAASNHYAELPLFLQHLRLLI